MNKLHDVDLHDVEVYLQTRNLVDERHLPYYVRWLQRFLAGPGGDGRLAWEDAQRAFVEQLERDAVPEWQVRQAARAVELYQKHYRRVQEEQGGETPGEARSMDRPGSPQTWPRPWWRPAA